MRPSCRPFVVALLVLACAQPVRPGDPSRILGDVITPGGHAATGCDITVMSIDDGGAYRSGPTDDDGRFEMRVPGGSRYRAVTIGLPDGRAIPVRGAPALAPEPGHPARIALRVVPAAPAPAASGSGRPWYASAPVLIGIAAGVVAMIVILHDDTPAPSSPTDPES